MGNPEFGSAFGVPYEFYASVSGVEPKYAYTLTQHQVALWEKEVGPQADLPVLAEMFFASKSGLTPPQNYSTYRHALAYFNSFNLPSNMVDALTINLRESTLMAVVLTDTLDSLNDTAFGTFMDALDYASVTIQVAGTWAGTISFQVSNDGVNWVSKNVVTATSGITSSTTSNNVFSTDIAARYFRAAMTAYTSGSATITAGFSTQSIANNIGTQSVSGTINANTSGVVEQAETSTNLAANATYTGGTRDLGTTVSTRSTLVRPMIMHTAGNTPGMLILQESTDGATWRETRRTPVPSDTSYRSFEWPVHMRYYRLLFTNGATAQTGFYLHAVRSQGEGGTMDAKNNLSFLLSTAALAASATFTSPTLDLGDNHIWDTVRARVNLGTASTTTTVTIQSSHDGTSWANSPAAQVQTTAAGIVSIERPITERYLRLVVVNGATTQASNQMTLALVSL